MAAERPVRITYDPEARAAYVYLSDRAGVVRTTWVTPDVGVDRFEDGEVFGIELLGVGKPAYLGKPVGKRHRRGA